MKTFNNLDIYTIGLLSIMVTVSSYCSFKSYTNFLFIQNIWSAPKYHNFDVLYDYISKNEFCHIIMAAILNFFNFLHLLLVQSCFLFPIYNLLLSTIILIYCSTIFSKKFRFLKFLIFLYGGHFEFWISGISHKVFWG